MTSLRPFLLLHIVAGALILGAPGLAVAQQAAPAAPKSPNEAQMIIWGGGATREVAEKSLAEYQAFDRGWERFYTLAPGFPRILESKTVTGLKPGFFVVVLGACPEASPEPVADLLRFFKPAIYTRPVTWSEAPAACPKRASSDWAVERVERLKKKAGELSVAELRKDGSTDWRLLMLLRDKSGAVLDTKETDSKKAVPDRAISCSSNDVSIDEEVSIDVSCELPGCTTLSSESYTWVYRVVGTSIESKKRNEQYTEGECDR